MPSILDAHNSNKEKNPKLFKSLELKTRIKELEARITALEKQLRKP